MLWLDSGQSSKNLLLLRGLVLLRCGGLAVFHGVLGEETSCRGVEVGGSSWRWEEQTDANRRFCHVWMWMWPPSLDTLSLCSCTNWRPLPGSSQNHDSVRPRWYSPLLPWIQQCLCCCLCVQSSSRHLACWSLAAVWCDLMKPVVSVHASFCSTCAKNDLLNSL